MTKEELNSKKLPELRELAESMGLKSLAGKGKGELISRILVRAANPDSSDDGAKKRGRRPKGSVPSPITESQSTVTLRHTANPGKKRGPKPKDKTQVATTEQGDGDKPQDGEYTGKKRGRKPKDRTQLPITVSDGTESVPTEVKSAPAENDSTARSDTDNGEQKNDGGNNYQRHRTPHYRDVRDFNKGQSYVPRGRQPETDRRGYASSGDNRDGRHDSNQRQQRNWRDSQQASQTNQGVRPAVNQQEATDSDNSFACAGVLEVVDSYGFLRTENYYSGNKDIYVAPPQIYHMRLKQGDFVEGKGCYRSHSDKYPALVQIVRINGREPKSTSERRITFESLTPIFPQERFIRRLARDSEP